MASSRQGVSIEGRFIDCNCFLFLLLTNAFNMHVADEESEGVYESGWIKFNKPITITLLSLSRSCMNYAQAIEGGPVTRNVAKFGTSQY